jgi:hypothetical protein
MITSQQFARTTRQLARLESMIARMLDPTYSIFVTDHCLVPWTRSANRDCFSKIHNLNDITYILGCLSGTPMPRIQKHFDLMQSGATRFYISGPTITASIATWQFHDTIDGYVEIVAQFLEHCRRAIRALIQLQRAFRHRYYQPGGLGYQRARANYTQLTQAEN